MQTFYLTRTMNLIGASFKIYTPVTFDNVKHIERDSNGKIKKVIAEDGYTTEVCRYYEILDKPTGYNAEEIDLLPYFADVTEDIPAKYKIKPKTYNNCQLTTDYPNGYFVFLDHKTGEKLKIAMNSHTYHPCNKKIVSTNA